MAPLKLTQPNCCHFCVTSFGHVITKLWSSLHILTVADRGQSKLAFLNSLSAMGDIGRQLPLLPPRLRATTVDTIIHNYRLSVAP